MNRKQRIKQWVPLGLGLVHLGSLSPLIWLGFAIPAGTLGGDPVKELIHFLGMGAIRLLLLCLTVAPLVKDLRLGAMIRLRRPLGLWCFVWASLHFASWMILDLGLQWQLIGSEVIERRYILVGFTAWALLAILAITSLPLLIRRLGRHWKRLHRSLYAAALLVCLHFWWSVKSGWLEPATYLTIAATVLAVRLRWQHLLPRVKGFAATRTGDER